ncbi:DUF6629 family protein [Streptomyces xanthophaeus]|uniref:DUF6629 family protein n=1 Tax=Streptomyces xanthophaeus TaxID=67385 RepID=UPI00343C6B50
MPDALRGDRAAARTPAAPAASPGRSPPRSGAAGAVIRAALRRLESASTRCAFAAVASVLVLGWVRRREPAVPVT